MFSEERLDSVIDGTASEQDLVDFAEWLEDPENMRRYALRAELHANLRRGLVRKSIQLDAEAHCNLAKSAPEQRNGKAAQPRNRLRMLAAAGLAIAASLSFLFLWNDGSTRLGVRTSHAAIVGAVDALLVKNEETWKADKVTAGDFHLRQGLLNLEFKNGVMLFLEAPAKFNAIDEDLFILHQGRLSAHVPETGIGFTVQTPQADVVDFGTEFSIDAESDVSEVHVFDGRVRVQPGSDSAKSIESVDVLASQAVRITEQNRKPVDIEIAKDRFIRDFEEPRRKYARSIKRLSPIAYYRMPIRDRGLACDPLQFSGEVLTGKGVRPAHARGVFTGGSLRVKADSIGRGGRVDEPPNWTDASFSIAVYVYLEQREPGIIATNIDSAAGCFELFLDEDGHVCVRVREDKDDWSSTKSKATVAVKQWTQLVISVGNGQLQIYVDGKQDASEPCLGVSADDEATWWFGTSAIGERLWNGRIDELAVFDYPLDANEIDRLYQDALFELEQIK